MMTKQNPDKACVGIECPHGHSVKEPEGVGCFAREAQPGVNEHNPDTRSVGIECMSERTPKERMSGGHSVSEPRAQSRGWAGQGE